MLISLIMSLLSVALPACQAEDSTDCYWDASERGNGIGHDVARVSDGANELWVIVRPDGSGIIHAQPIELEPSVAFYDQETDSLIRMGE